MNQLITKLLCASLVLLMADVAFAWPVISDVALPNVVGGADFDPCCEPEPADTCCEASNAMTGAISPCCIQDSIPAVPTSALELRTTPSPYGDSGQAIAKYGGDIKPSRLSIQSLASEPTVSPPTRCTVILC